MGKWYSLRMVQVIPISNRQTKVCIASSYSKPRLLNCGVPQGSVLGARLYTMYTRPIADIMNRHNVYYHSYADDSQLYIVCNNDENSIKQVVKQLEDCITDVCEMDEKQFPQK